MRRILCFLIIICTPIICVPQGSRLSLDVRGVYTLPKGAFHQTEISNGNAASGFGGALGLTYQIIPEVGIGFLTGVDYFGAYDHTRIPPLNYLFIPLDLEAKISWCNGIVNPFFSFGGGTSVSLVFLNIGGYKRSDSKMLSNLFCSFGVSIPITSRISCVAGYGLHETSSKDQTFNYPAESPPEGILASPGITLTPKFDADFDELSLGLQVGLF